MDAMLEAIVPTGKTKPGEKVPIAPNNQGTNGVWKSNKDTGLAYTK